MRKLALLTTLICACDHETASAPTSSNDAGGDCALALCPPGPPGVPGSPGAPGESGPIGETGPQGEVGPVGPMGSSGPPGEMGPTGPQGEQGLPGEMGPMGPMGATGSSGEACDPTDDNDSDGFADWVEMAALTDPYNSEDKPEDINLDGIADILVGPEGPAGESGPEGSAGPEGPMGLQGPQGDLGPEGPMGPTGLTGEPGPEGPMGLTGLTGDPGPEGPMGLTGPVGPMGLTGPIGPTGEPGPTPTTACPVETTEIYQAGELVYCLRLPVSSDPSRRWPQCLKYCGDLGLEIVWLQDLMLSCLDNSDIFTENDAQYWLKNVYDEEKFLAVRRNSINDGCSMNFCSVVLEGSNLDEAYNYPGECHLGHFLQKLKGFENDNPRCLCGASPKF